MPIEKPDVSHSRGSLDFGKGFYLTSYKEQAENWAYRKSMRSGGAPYVSVFDCAVDEQRLNVLRFGENDRDWLDFVCACRRGGKAYLNYDLIIGGVADDKVFYAVDMYFNGAWDAETTLDALRFFKRNDQYCFVTQKAVDCALTFASAAEVGE